ncbi:MmcQ/YjbR family DNA-binding protein [Roseomonas frigidaquae]|uniref:MmcQ/YjbR family DNA-binding protein n=1 Tax=Falsiroseomonas frigidaquae TaxID=487318 RepID=A0ABX1ETV7_9PROT|nr:MmcQ/YjbR family DNA-binding protein [Falsiroseomonas frigidaquae]NKE43344.1 MmcQ/YjbR family DNA-binding protein [Falsiroseomonas frigidaquae]
MVASPTARLRRLCLTLPEAAEVETWEQPTFRVRGRIFAMLHQGEHGLAVWFKAPPGSQEVLTEAAPDRFFRPPYLGHKGWVALRLGGAVDWDEAEALIRRSYSLIAPKRLAAQAAGHAATQHGG